MTDLAKLEQETFNVVEDYARALNDTLAKRIIHTLRRAKATGAYDDYRHRTRWDELCHEWQHGPHGFLRDAWEQDIEPHLEHVAGLLPETEQLLLTAAAIWNFNDLGNFDGELVVSPELLQRGVMEALVEQAMARDLTRFDPR